MKKVSVKTLFKRIFLIITPIYILWFLYIEFMPMYFVRPTSTRWLFLKNSLEKSYQLPESNKLFLGESRLNAAVDFTKFSGSYSFASGGSTPIEMYYVLEKYIEKHSIPDTVMLSISPRFLTETFAFYPFAVRNNFITIPDFWEISNHLNKGDTTLGKFPRFKFLLYKLNYIEYYQSDILYNHGFSGYKKNKELINEMMNMQGGRPHPGLKDSCSDLNYETKFKHFTYSPILRTYFDKLLTMCWDNDIYLIFDFVPMNESSFNVLNKDFIIEYRNFIKTYKAYYPFYAISDTVYSYPDIYFGDESHLNSKGKEKYTSYLIETYF